MLGRLRDGFRVARAIPLAYGVAAPTDVADQDGLVLLLIQFELVDLGVEPVVMRPERL